MTELYLISPPQFDPATFAQALEEVLAACHAPVFQLRMKQDAEGLVTADDDAILSAAKILQPICRSHNVQFIINDAAHLIKEAGADGAHIGIDDGEVAQVRAAIGEEVVLGVSCYGSIDRAMEAGEQGADYVAFGAFYPTTTKTPRARPKPDLLTQWVSIATPACVAIGGITPHNAAPLIEAGADYLAVVSYIWNHPEGAATAAKEFQALFGKYPSNEA